MKPPTPEEVAAWHAEFKQKVSAVLTNPEAMQWFDRAQGFREAFANMGGGLGSFASTMLERLALIEQIWGVERVIREAGWTGLAALIR
jgi:hypothetical protein